MIVIVTELALHGIFRTRPGIMMTDIGMMIIEGPVLHASGMIIIHVVTVM